MISSSSDLPGEGRLSSAWTPFETKLAGVLATLEEDQYLVLVLKQSNRFVQFAGQGAYGMRVETTSNQYLSKQEQLGPATMSALVGLGWCNPTGAAVDSTPERDPDGSPNYYCEFAAPVPFEQAAKLAVRTLIEVVRVPHPVFLEYEAFDTQGSSLAFPELGLRAAVPAERIPDHDPAKLLSALEHITNVPSLVFDADGDIGLRYGSAMILIRIIESVGIHSESRVRLCCPMLRKLDATPLLFERLNDFNVAQGAVRFVFQNGSVYALAEMEAPPLTKDRLAPVFEQFCASADSLGSVLQAEFGGELGFPEPMASVLRH